MPRVWEFGLDFRRRPEKSASGSIEYSTFTIPGSTIAEVNNRDKAPYGFIAAKGVPPAKKKPVREDPARAFSNRVKTICRNAS
jgi:hypothetical protein